MTDNQMYRSFDGGTRQQKRADALLVPEYDSYWTAPTEAEMEDLTIAHPAHCSCAPCQRHDYFQALTWYSARTGRCAACRHAVEDCTCR